MINSRQEEKTAAEYDVAIVGAGVSGSALAYVLRRFTDVGRIALIEKCDSPAEINSADWNNSQTLHFGDIETNYNLDKSKQVKAAADLVRRYLEQHDPDGKVHTRYHKMVLGVGEEEGSRLQKRYENYRETFPALELIDHDRIAELEPTVTENRDDATALNALFTRDGYAVDFGRLAESFIERVRESESDDSRTTDLMFGIEVASIDTLDGGGYRLRPTEGPEIKSRFIAVMAGGHSLLFAKRLGYGRKYGLLSVAGSFYLADKQLNGKVYTMQVKGLPFAAPHGDPEVHDPSKTRFGPTAKPLPLLERHHYNTVGDYFSTLGFNWPVIASLFRILGRPLVFRFVVMNALYEIPYLGKRLFLRQIRRIVPSLRPSEIRRAKGYGGVRPQIVDTEARDLDMGEAKIDGENARFNITPSPGASVSLESARADAAAIAEALGDCHFDAERFDRELGEAAETATAGQRSDS